MSAGKEISLTSNIPKLGIVAGSGIIPRQLDQACQELKIPTYIVGIKGSTDEVTPDFWSRVGTSGKTIQWLQENNIHDIVMIGAVKRPGLFDLWPDWVTFKFFLKAWMKSFGDNSLLMAARQELANRNIKIHGAHKFLPELLMPEGEIGSHQIPSERQSDIRLGIKESQKLGKADIGQAVIVKDGEVLGYEDKGGTSRLIQAYGELGAILVKTCKPQQDKDLDMPTIGPQTIQHCADKKMAGVIGHSGNSLLVEKDLVRDIADKNGMFVAGVMIDEQG